VTWSQRRVITIEIWAVVIEAMQRMTVEATLKENDYSKHFVKYFQSWHMGPTNMNVFTLQTALQESNTINEIFFITSYTCYIYPTTKYGNLKWKWCAYDTEITGKLKVVQYADCNNNRQMAREFNVSEKQVWDCWKAGLHLPEMPRAKKPHGGKPSFPQEEQEPKNWICDHRQQL